ncbi:MAG: membrane protein insertion efficiency factor YidD [Chloroflexia bacterium]|nr:membrane protein insertion efficiency factor YidD [Chloroflexia bacterium]
MRYAAMGLIRVYQSTLSKVLPPSCRFYPSCSQYGYEAFEKYGIFKGGWLTAWRILRCNPWTRGGHDPVP